MSAIPLHALQHWMLDTLIAPCEARASGAPCVDDIVLPGAHIDATACLAIYQRSYLLRLRLCLREQFPATCHALGQTLFDDFADDYLRACPSDSYTLYALGRRFADWLSDSRPDRDLPEDQREDWIDFMIDLAHYEHTLFRLFDAPGHEERVWPDAACQDSTLRLQPCLILAHYRYPVAWYYHEVRAGRSPSFPQASASHLVILRRDYRAATYPVSALHFRFLERVRDQGNIEHALADIAGLTGRSLEDVTRSWHADVREAWLDAGFFVEAGT